MPIHHPSSTIQCTVAGDAGQRLRRLTEYSPSFAHLLERHPEYAQWVELENNLGPPFLFSAFKKQWLEDTVQLDLPTRAAFQAALQQFRRKMSFRIAYRDVNQLASVETLLTELSLLAEFCLQQAYEWCLQQWTGRLGTPWNDTADQPARFCILALGKFGGCELNFCSDLDLIFLYDGDGSCRREDRITSVTSAEFYGRLIGDLCKLLQERTAHGYLYNIDLRLRPEGQSGAAVRSFTSMANHYWSAGQPWERLALIRARPVAGDKSLGAELLEELNPFRYPRATSPSLLQEIAGVKVRTEREVVGSDKLIRDIKSGHGGIREIEFHVQALQLLQAGRNPFLQSGSTYDAIERLERYGFLDRDDARFLARAYRFLRSPENRLQIREDERTHELPESPQQFDAIATSYQRSPSDLRQELATIRSGVRQRYVRLFTESTRENELQDWTLFLGGDPALPEMEQALQRWFGAVADRDDRIRNFALGASRHLVTREQVSLFMDISTTFDTLLPQLARPLLTLERLGHFAQSYGARKQFFKACLLNPRLFQMLSLLFDRSSFIAELLRKHPEIMEELIHQPAGRDKTINDHLNELRQLGEAGDDWPRLLWLYVKAEQVRFTSAELLTSNHTAETVEENLTQLAEAVVRFIADKVDPQQQLAFIAVGKFGSQELSLGSDLDIIVIGPGDDDGRQTRLVQQFCRYLEYRLDLGRTYTIDLRLRPYGNDGPLVTNIDAFAAYHTSGKAGLWERQLLTRARPVSGNLQLSAEFIRLRDKLLCTPALPPSYRQQIWSMRQKIELEKSTESDSFLAYKTGTGGLIDIEFFVQTLQLERFTVNGKVTLSSTRSVLKRLINTGIIPTAIGITLLDAYNQLRHLELCLRRDTFSEVDHIPTATDQQNALALWLGYATIEDMRASLSPIRGKTRKIVETFFSGAGLDTLP